MSALAVAFLLILVLARPTFGGSAAERRIAPYSREVKLRGKIISGRTPTHRPDRRRLS